MCIAMYIMRTCAPRGHGGGNAEGEEREKDWNGTGEWGKESSDEKEEENRRQKRRREKERMRLMITRKKDDKRGRKRGGHADEGKGGGGGGERWGRVEARREAKRRYVRESIEVYEKTIELICKQ